MPDSEHLSAVQLGNDYRIGGFDNVLASLKSTHSDVHWQYKILQDFIEDIKEDVEEAISDAFDKGVESTEG